MREVLEDIVTSPSEPSPKNACDGKPTKLPLPSNLTTFHAEEIALVSSLVTYLFVPLGVPLVPARASFSDCVGNLPSLSPTAIGALALAGATDSLVRPFVEAQASVSAIA